MTWQLMISMASLFFSGMAIGISIATDLFKRADKRKREVAATICNVCDGYYDHGPGRAPCGYCTKGIRKCA